MWPIGLLFKFVFDIFLHYEDFVNVYKCNLIEKQMYRSLNREEKQIFVIFINQICLQKASKLVFLKKISFLTTFLNQIP